MHFNEVKQCKLYQKYCASYTNSFRLWPKTFWDPFSIASDHLTIKSGHPWLHQVQTVSDQIAGQY